MRSRIYILVKVLTMIIMMCLTHLLSAQDWPNLNRYQAENKLLTESSDDENRIVFMGNSITEGWMADTLSFFYTKKYINRGISGQTTPQMLVRFRADVIDLKPKVVVILAGINDIAGNTGPSTIKMIADNLMSMAELAISNDIDVILCSVLPANDFPWKPDMEPAEKVIALNGILKSYADQKNISYLDYFSSMVDDRNGLSADLTYDGVHPTVQGYRVMEPLVQKVIDELLTDKRAKE